MTRLQFSGIDDIKRQFANNGSPYFTPETMRWWRSRVYETLYGPGGRVFVTSERNTLGDYPRVYSVRLVNFDDDAGKYSVRTIGGIGACKTLKAAKDAAGLLGRVIARPDNPLPRYVDRELAASLAKQCGISG